MRHGTAPAGAMARMATVVGKPVTAYIVTVETEDGDMHTFYPAGQDPRITADLAAGAVRQLLCSGCDACRRC